MRIVLSVIAARSSSRLIQIHESVGLDREIGDLAAFFFQVLAGIEHSLVFGCGGDDVVALFGVHLRDALDRQVVRFRRTAREDDFLRVRANQIRDLLTRDLDGFFGLPSERMVAARRVPELLGEVRHHRLEHPWIDGRRRVIVHVDRKLHRFLRPVQKDPPSTTKFKTAPDGERPPSRPALAKQHSPPRSPQSSRFPGLPQSAHESARADRGCCTC